MRGAFKVQRNFLYLCLWWVSSMYFVHCFICIIFISLKAGCRGWFMWLMLCGLRWVVLVELTCRGQSGTFLGCCGVSWKWDLLYILNIYCIDVRCHDYVDSSPGLSVQTVQLQSAAADVITGTKKTQLIIPVLSTSVIKSCFFNVIAHL